MSLIHSRFIADSLVTATIYVAIFGWGRRKHGKTQAHRKVTAAAVTAILAWLATLGIDIGKQEELLINAAAPIIVGYLWADSWEFRPKKKIVAAFFSALVLYLLFRFGIPLNKSLENLINAVVPVIVALFFQDSANPEGSANSEGASRVR